MAAAPVELWSTRLSCPQLHRRISSLPQQLPSATLGEPENPSLNSDPGCIKVVDTYRSARIPSAPGSRSRCTSGSSSLWHGLQKVQILCLRCRFRPPPPSRKGAPDRGESAQTACDEG